MGHTEPVEPTAEEVRRQLDRIVASEGFANADRMSRFLGFVVERALAGESDQVKEYVVGIEVFGRDEQYDPRLDSIVRVEARRLRAKLDEYYAREGVNDPVIITMRRGSYAASFELRRAAAPTIPEANRPALHPTLATARRHPRLALALYLAAAVPIGFLVYQSGYFTTIGRTEPVATIAVLPFAHYSGDPADDRLAAAITDGVTSELARLGSLSVVARTSTLEFANRRRPLREIAEALDVDVVIEGTVTREAERVRVSARLVDVASQQKAWVEDFVGPALELRDLERRIAVAAADAARSRRSR
jgi:TolB-like protein